MSKKTNAEVLIEHKNFLVKVRDKQIKEIAKMTKKGRRINKSGYTIVDLEKRLEDINIFLTDIELGLRGDLRVIAQSWDSIEEYLLSIKHEDRPQNS
jgi:hypothetical protein